MAKYTKTLNWKDVNVLHMTLELVEFSLLALSIKFDISKYAKICWLLWIAITLLQQNKNSWKYVDFCISVAKNRPPPKALVIFLRFVMRRSYRITKHVVMKILPEHCQPNLVFCLPCSVFALVVSIFLLYRFLRTFVVFVQFGKAVLDVRQRFSRVSVNLSVPQLTNFTSK